MHLTGKQRLFVAVFGILPLCIHSQRAVLPPDSDFPFPTLAYLGPDHGLSHAAVSGITQDSLGFMWFITQNGLNRYDGYEFRSWAYRGDDPYSLPVGDYYAMSVDRDGNIWMPHLNEGIYSFDPYCEEFSQHLSPRGNERQIENMALVTERNGSIWIGTSYGLKKYDPATLSTERFLHNAHDTTTLSNNFLYGLVLDENSSRPDGINLWIVNVDLGIDGFNTQSGKVIRRYRPPYPRSEFNWSPNAIMNIMGKRKDIIWIGSNDRAIYGFNTITGLYTRIPMKQPCVASSHIIGLYTVMEDRRGNLWTVNDNNEIVFVERKTNQFYIYGNIPASISFVQSDCILFEDNNHMVWVGSRRGLVTIDTRNNAFRAIQSPLQTAGPVIGNDVFDIQRIHTGEILVTTGVVSTFNKDKRRFDIIETIRSRTKDIALRYLYEDPQGLLWVTGYRGILSYDPITHVTREYTLRDSTGYEYEGFRDVIRDGLGNYWAYGYAGIIKFDPVTLLLEDYTMKIGPAIPKTIVAAYLDSRGYIYLSWRHGKGMILYDPRTNLSKVFSHNAHDPQTISIDMPTEYLEDQYGHIWVGTEGGGLNVFNAVTEHFKSFTIEDGLPDDYIRSLVADKEKRIWVGTPQGLSSFVPPKNPFSDSSHIVFKNYSVSDGLPVNNFFYSSAFCDEDGTLYFGTGGRGLVYFHPDNLSSTGFVPPVYLTGLHVNNKPLSIRDTQSVLSEAIEYAKEIRLQHTQNIISFTFAALNYLRPEKNIYAYMLDGYDDDWIFTNAQNRRATYTNLNPGTYTFKVKGNNNDGVWNETPAQLSIIITPAFWQTWWFKFVVVMAVAALIYAFYRYRLNQVLKMQRIRNRIAHDLHDNIGSTLTSISIYSEIAQKKSEGRIPELDLIGENSRKVIDSMSDIVWTINPDNDSFSKIIFRMHSQTHYLMKAKGIEYSFKVDEALNGIALPMQTRQNFYLIYKEAVNNLLKYSNATEVNISVTNGNHSVKLHIQDNGIGFHVDQSSSGNGMQSMRQRAKAMKADFSIQSKPGEGTKVLLSIPV